MDLTYIEENFVFCTYCGDHGWINSLLPYPCPRCNREDYLEWLEGAEEEKQKWLEKVRGREDES